MNEAFDVNAYWIAQPGAEFLVVVEPPEAGPGERNRGCARSAQTFELTKSGFVVRRGAPVHALLFEEGNCVAVRQSAAQLVFVHQYEFLV